MHYPSRAFCCGSAIKVTLAGGCSVYPLLLMMDGTFDRKLKSTNFTDGIHEYVATPNFLESLVRNFFGDEQFSQLKKDGSMSAKAVDHIRLAASTTSLFSRDVLLSCGKTYDGRTSYDYVAARKLDVRNSSQAPPSLPNYLII